MWLSSLACLVVQSKASTCIMPSKERTRRNSNQEQRIRSSVLLDDNNIIMHICLELLNDLRFSNKLPVGSIKERRDNI